MASGSQKTKGRPRAARPRSAPMVRTTSAIFQSMSFIGISLTQIVPRKMLPVSPNCDGMSFSNYHRPDAPPPPELPPPKPLDELLLCDGITNVSRSLRLQ